MENLRLRQGGIAVFAGKDGEIEFSRLHVDGLAAVSGKGAGNLKDFRQLWECVLTWAHHHRIRQLWCEPTMTDGRGKTRQRVYSRVGFVPAGEYTMILNL